ncbi:4-aminobutyrate--2-oxoglutarate transaminase [Novispirillum sp. DQ9]|uniref:4-aminobutyrate--2-oxoglutarate transaminase n=1 Tax=Novispirillum sp. DQ9 TaxID=3398612 RepID=UPI003C7B7225
MTANADLLARRTAAIPKGVGNLTAIYAQRAQGAELWDVEGRRYIDFASGIAVLNTGHNHPRITAAVAEQLGRFSHTCFHVAPYEGYVALAERLNALVPGATPKQTMFVTTGAEAVENAIKVARHHTGRSGVIAFSGAFHGRTLMGMALTGKVMPYKAGFGPFPGEIYHAPFPNAYRGVTVEDSLKGLDALFKSDVDPARVAAMIVEPVQGEGGFNIAPAEWLQALRGICDTHGIVLIVDEIQTGFARTGKLFAIEHAGIEPDLMTMAKSLAGGFPLSALTGKKHIMDSVHPGGLGGTYGGSPIGIAAALAVLDIINDEKLCERAARQGDLMVGRLTTMAQRFAAIGQVRNLGAMVAMELVKNRDTREPDADLTKALAAKAAEKGLILLTCGTYANVVRFLAPLVASDALLGEGLDIVETCLEDLTGA